MPRFSEFLRSFQDGSDFGFWIVSAVAGVEGGVAVKVGRSGAIVYMLAVLKSPACSCPYGGQKTEDDDDPFEEKMQRLTAKLAEQFAARIAFP